MIVAVIALVVLAALGGFLSGYGVAVRAEVRKRLRELGFTPRAGKLYTRAAKLLNRLVAVTDLDGPFGADILSEETRKQVNDWLADYRKEISKV